jgi:hypothetical protein
MKYAAPREGKLPGVLTFRRVGGTSARVTRMYELEGRVTPPAVGPSFTTFCTSAMESGGSNPPRGTVMLLILWANVCVCVVLRITRVGVTTEGTFLNNFGGFVVMQAATLDFPTPASPRMNIR